MRISIKFLCGVFCAAFVAPAIGANVATTAGSNLTAYNGTGSTNNNNWNNLMNGRGGMSQTTADANFGNCNAVILRCASPKCANGACYDMNVARPIVAGCVNSNNSCKKHGDDLIDYISAQIVAQSNAKQQEQANAVAIAQAQAEAQASASAAAAAQSNAQMQQMQAQMQAMQEQMAESMNAMQAQMAAQTESQNAQIQSALDAQRESMAAYNTPAATTAADSTGAVIEGLEGLGVAEQLAAKNGVSADILVREQIGGQIETAIEDATQAMKDLKVKLDAVLEYAGCDPSATNCTGPKRVKKFKDLANEFFDPYENVVENVYDALILAMTVGINVNDVIMLLSDSCNMWGRYLCDSCNNNKADANCECDTNNENCYYRVATDKNTYKVSKEQPHCRLLGILNESETVWREWIDPNTGMMGATQVACASDVVMNIPMFRNMKKKATMSIDGLRDLVAQDSRACRGKMEGNDFVLTPSNDTADACWLNRCAVEQGSEYYDVLRNAADTRKLPEKKLGVGSKVADVLCYTNEKSLPEVRLTGVNIKVDGFRTNIGDCGIYITEFTCGLKSDSCTWLQSSKMCVANEANTEPTEAALDKYGKAFCLQHYSQDWCDDYYKHADANLKTEPTELWQNSYLQPIKTPTSIPLTEDNTTLTTKKTFGDTLINMGAATRNFGK